VTDAGRRLILDAFSSRIEAFPELFRRVLAMTSVTTISFTTRRLVLAFVIHAFQSLDVAFVKKELASLAQIHIWAGLSSEERRNLEFDRHPPLRKIWRGSVKRFDAAGIVDLLYILTLDDETKAKLRFEQSWLYSLILDFISISYNAPYHTDGSFHFFPYLFQLRYYYIVNDLSSS